MSLQCPQDTTTPITAIAKTNPMLLAVRFLPLDAFVETAKQNPFARSRCLPRKIAESAAVSVNPLNAKLTQRTR